MRTSAAVAAGRISAAQPIGSNSCSEKPSIGGVGGDGVAVSRSAWSAAQRNPARRLANSASTQSSATRWRGPSHRSHGRRPARRSSGRDDRGRRRSCRWRPAAPRRTGGSSPTSHSGHGRHLLDGDQRLAHQRIQHVQHCVLVERSSQRLRGGGQVEPAGEHRTAAQHRPLVIVEQVVRPLHGVAQRLVAFQPAPRPRQQPEPVTQTIADILGAHRHHPRRRQLDRQRDPIQTAGRSRSPPPPRPSSSSPKPGFTAWARSTNNSTAADAGPAGDIQRRDGPQVLGCHP